MGREPATRQIGLASGREGGEQRLETTSPELGEPPPRRVRRLPVVVDRETQVSGEPLPHAVRASGRVGQAQPLERNEREDVEGSHARVDALMAAQVEVVSSEAGRGDRCSLYARRITDEGDDRSVVVGIGRPVEHLRSARLDHVHQLPDERRVAALAEVGHGLEHGNHGAT